MLESHSHAPVATAEEFAADCDLAGDALAADWRAPHPRGPLTFAGFAAAMDAHGPWQALPLRHAQVDASGPVEQAFFDAFVDALCTRLRAAMPVDGVFLSLHGAAIATGDPDPDGTVLERVRGIVGPDVPVVATLDLHANVVQRMVDHADVLIAYRENPHTDLAARGADCAAALREMLAGMRPARAFVKLPFVPPSIAQNTASGPYRALIEHGQALRGAIEQVYCIAAHAAGYRYAGATDCMIIADIARMQGVPAETIEAGLERCTEIANQAFAACLPTLSIEPLPGVTQTLQRLRAAGHRLGLVTGNLEPGQASGRAFVGGRFGTFGAKLHGARRRDIAHACHRVHHNAQSIPAG